MEWWLVAVILTLFGTSFSAFGLCLQKYSHMAAKELESDTSGDEGRPRLGDEAAPLQAADDRAGGCACPTYCTRAWWLLGMAVFLTGHILCWFALALGTQSVLSCINCWSMVVTFVVAPGLLGETVSVFRMLSVVLLIAGCLIVIIYGPRRYSEYTVEKLVAGWQSWTIQVITGFVICLGIYFLARASVSRRRPRISTFQATLVASMLGWYSVLCAKCTAGLFFTSVHHDNNQYNTIEAWILVVVTITLAVSNIHFMNVALESGDAVQVVPLYESLSIMGQISIGGIFFKEFDHLTLSQHLSFWSGVALVILGVVCMTSAGPEILQMPFLSPAETPKTWTPVLGGTPSRGTPIRTPVENRTPTGSRTPVEGGGAPPEQQQLQEKLLFRKAAEPRNYQATGP